MLLLISVCFASLNGEQVASAKINYRAEGYINNGYIQLRVPYDTDYQKIISGPEIERKETGGFVKVRDDFQVNLEVDIDYSQIEISEDIKIEKHNVGFLGKTKKIDPNLSALENMVKDFDSEYVFETVKEVTQFVYHYINYDSSRIGKDPYDTLDIISKKKGVCVEYAVLAASLLRAKGIPTKYIVGFVKAGKEFEQHGWIEFYTEEYGWLPADPTKNQMINIDATHVKIGEEEDPTELYDKIVFSGSEADYEKDYEVEIKTEKKFPTLFSEISANPNKVGFRSFSDINVEVKNDFNKMAFITALMLHDEHVEMFDDVSKILVLNPRETRNFVWKLKSNDAPVKSKTIIHTFKLKSQAIEGETTLEVAEIYPKIEYSEIKIKKDYEIMEEKVRIILEVQNTGNKDLDGTLSVADIDIIQEKEIVLLSGEKKTFDYYFSKDQLNVDLDIKFETEDEMYETEMKISTGLFFLETEYLIIIFIVILVVVALFTAARAIVK